MEEKTNIHYPSIKTKDLKGAPYADAFANEEDIAFDIEAIAEVKVKSMPAALRTDVEELFSSLDEEKKLRKFYRERAVDYADEFAEDLFKEIADSVHRTIVLRAQLRNTIDMYDNLKAGYYVRFTFPSRKEYILALILLQINFYRFFPTTSQSTMFHGVFYISFYIMLYLLIGMPIVMVQLAFGQYGKATLIKMWQAIPVFSGMMISMILVTALSQIRLMWRFGSVVYYLSTSLVGGADWSSCKWNKDPQLTCYDVSTNATRTADCCFSPRCPADSSLQTTTLQYYRYLQNETFSNNMTDPKANCITIYLCLWFSFFYIVYTGIEGYTKMLRKLAPCVLVFLMYLLLHSFIYGNLSDIRSGIEEIFQIDLTYFSLQVFMDVVSNTQIALGLLIVVSVYAPANSRPDKDAILFSIAHIATLIFFELFTYIAAGTLKAHFETSSVTCFTQNGLDMSMATIPMHIALKGAAGPTTFVYFLVFLLSTTNVTVLAGFTNFLSFWDIYPHLPETRVFHILAFSAFGCLVNIGVDSGFDGETTTRIEKNYIIFNWLMFTFISFMFTLVIVGIYSVERLFDDIEFEVGMRPSAFWFALINLSLPLYMVLYVSSIFYYSDPDLVKMYYTAYFGGLLLGFAPMMSVLCFRLARYCKLNTPLSKLLSKRNWPGHDRATFAQRQSFNPAQQKREAQSTWVCNECGHECLKGFTQLDYKDAYIDSLRNVYIATHDTSEEQYNEHGKLTPTS